MKSTASSSTLVAFDSPWYWAVPLLSFGGLLVVYVSGTNVVLFQFLNHILSYANDSIWLHLSLLADGQLVILFVLPFLGRRPDVVWQYILATILGGLFVYGMKELFSVMRPPASLLAGSFHLIGPDLQNNSFPSGHTTAFFVLAGLVCMQQVNIGFKILILLLATLVGLSRIASGVHWPLDVLGAAFGGWFVALAAIWLGRYWRAGLNIWVQRILAVIVTTLSLWAVWTLWHDYGEIYPGTGFMQVSLLVICLALSVPGQLRLFGLK
jgi:membrane-associated phospholipid phosphatase